MMAEDNTPQDRLSELSQHYDSMLWTVTSLWSVAIGGLLVYLNTNFDPWLAVFGIGLTVCAMEFAASFRRLRRRVHDQMSDDFRRLCISHDHFRQWHVFLIVFCSLLVLWTRLLIVKRPDWLCVWISIGVVAFGLTCWRWWLGDAHY